jgi:protocatechuate 3,4-dioxygenase beta subunit
VEGRVIGRLAAAAVVVSVSAAVSTGSASARAAACRATPSSYGPFNTSGAVVPRRAKIGTGHVLTGRVLRFPACTPIRGATVEFWQRGKDGYDARGRGRVVTRRDGSFRFEGPVPTADEGRPAHIHVHVTAPGYQEVVTTYFLRRGEKTGRITIVLVSEL